MNKLGVVFPVFLLVRGNLRLGHLLSSVLLALALQGSLAVLVDLDLGDGHLGGGDPHVHALAVDLLLLQTLNVDDPPLAVHGGDLSLAALVEATVHDNLIILANGEGADLREKRKEKKGKN